MGQQSILHAVRARNQPISKRSLNAPTDISILEEQNEEYSKTLSQTLTGLQFSDTTTEYNTDTGKEL